MLWKQLLFGTNRSELPTKYTGKIEVFVRHCISSSVSQHKVRFPGFSRELCYKNLLDTIDLQKVNLTFFLDIAKGSKEDHFLKDELRHPVVEVQGGSESSSFLKLLDYVENLNLHPDTIVYFLEDDYLHRPGWVDVLLEGFEVGSADYVTLYDHKDKYFLPAYKKLQAQLFITPSCHWRSTPSTTQTFATRYHTLMKHLPIHRRFSEGRSISADHEKFVLLGKLGNTIVSSIPGWSTHAEPEFASPCIDWEKLLFTHV